jgi:DNA-binding response OmpR family regulator
VDAVDSVETARTAAAAAQYHLCLVDLSLPDQSGIDLVRELNQRDNSPAMIIITGHPSVNSATEAMQLGARNYLTKPVSPSELVAAVRSVLAIDGILVDSEEQLLAELGRRLKAARVAADLTMQALGDRIGISQAQISQIESGLSAPSLSTLFRMTRALRISMSEVFEGT